MESRRAPRYPVEAPVSFRWSEEGRSRDGEGWTRDISENGVFVYSACCPPPGAHTQLEVVLPPLGGEGRIIKIRMDAAVLRVCEESTRKEQFGFALMSTNVILKTGEEYSRVITIQSQTSQQELFAEIARSRGQIEWVDPELSKSDEEEEK